MIVLAMMVRAELRAEAEGWGLGVHQDVTCGTGSCHVAVWRRVYTHQWLQKQLRSKLNRGIEAKSGSFTSTYFVPRHGVDAGMGNG